MNTENTIRGLLARFGVRLRKHLQTYEQWVRKALEDKAVPAGVIEPLLTLRTEALRQAAILTKVMTLHSRNDEACRRLMTIPGVGAVSPVTGGAEYLDFIERNTLLPAIQAVPILQHRFWWTNIKAWRPHVPYGFV